MEVLRLPEKALPVFEQIKNDFPSSQINGSTDDLISGLKEMVEKKKIRDALAPGSPFPDSMKRISKTTTYRLQNTKAKWS